MVDNGDYKTSDGLRKFGEIALSMNEGYKKNIIKLFPDLISKNFENTGPGFARTQTLLVCLTQSVRRTRCLIQIIKKNLRCETRARITGFIDGRSPMVLYPLQLNIKFSKKREWLFNLL